MLVLDFVTEKEKFHGMNEELVEKDFGYHPFFNKIVTVLKRDYKSEIRNNGISCFSIIIDNVDHLEEAWDEVYSKYKKYFNI